MEMKKKQNISSILCVSLIIIIHLKKIEDKNQIWILIKNMNTKIKG